MSANKGISRVAGFLSKLRGDVGGNALAMMAAAMIPLAGMIGGGLDMSRAYMARAKLQNACDAAALAARQGMDGTNFTSSDTATANKYFNFNFPAGTMNANSVTFSVAKDPNDQAALIGSATAKIPTSLMKIFAYDEIDINVSCNVKRDLGNNDIMIVLDVTGSMNCDPGGADCDGDSNSKIARLRTGTLGLYRALQGDGTDRSRFGLMPYSGTVNVGRRLRTRDILRTTDYSECNNGYYYSWYWSGYPNGETGCSSVNADLTGIHINQTEWFNVDNGVGRAIRAWRLSGDACIEERPTIGNAASPIRISSTVSQADIDDIASSGSDAARQWGRYETPPTDRDGNFLFMPAYTQVACPSEAQKLTTYGSEAAFQTAVNNATAKVTGGTYHDIGLIWGARWLSPTGMFPISIQRFSREQAYRVHDGRDSGYRRNLLFGIWCRSFQ